MKTGRNEPCPCDSGKKYKKCCLKKDRAASPTSSSRTGRKSQSSNRVSYQLAEGNRKSEYPGAGRVRGLSDEQLFEELIPFGVTLEAKGFLEQCRGHTSAWELGSEWVDAYQGSRKLSRREINFLCLAAGSLWERLNSEYPSIEMLDDWMHEGYQKYMNGDGSGSVELWQRVWDGIRRHLGPTIRSPEDLDPILQGTQYVFNWIQDFELALLNAGIMSRDHARLGVAFLEEALVSFPDLDRNLRMNFQCSLAELHWKSGDQEKAEQSYQFAITQYERCAIGYAGLAEALTLGRESNGLDPDYQEAIKVLEQARSMVKDAEYYDLDELLAHMRAGLQGS